MNLTIEELRELLTQTPVASPATQTDTQRLACALEGEPEVDQHENFAGAAAAVIERLRHEVADAWLERDKARADGARMDEGARRNMADALGWTGTPTWERIELAARVLLAERDSLRGKLGECTAVADAVPVLSLCDVGADGCSITYNAQDARFAPGDDVLVGQWRYRVIERWLQGGTAATWGARLTPLDGAPVQPMGEGLMIARARQPGAEIDAGTPEEWAHTGIQTEPADAQLARIARAIEGDVDPSDTIADCAIAFIERLKDERARHEQRRLDLAEKLGLGSLGTWEQIADKATWFGLAHQVSGPVQRFALAMQERLDATRGQHPTDPGDCMRLMATAMDACSRARYSGVGRAVRVWAANLAAGAMFLAQLVGDLDTFDAAAEIAAARAKPDD